MLSEGQPISSNLCHPIPIPQLAWSDKQVNTYAGILIMLPLLRLLGWNPTLPYTIFPINVEEPSH